MWVPSTTKTTLRAEVARPRVGGGDEGGVLVVETRDVLGSHLEIPLSLVLFFFFCFINFTVSLRFDYTL